MELSELLKEHRTARGLSLAQMAALLVDFDVQRSRAMLHHYENERARVPREVLTAYVAALGLSMDEARELYEAGGLIVMVTA
tara:strand:- start:290 stop:535 length:246 start_codon:yes stop_codon:yes gene_type:complete